MKLLLDTHPFLWHADGHPRMSPPRDEPTENLLLIGWRKSFGQAQRPRATPRREAGRILKDEDLSVAINACPELKAFVETIVTLCSPK